MHTVVIGAGWAGLHYAAHAQLAPSEKLLLLEQGPRPGGRVSSFVIDNDKKMRYFLEGGPSRIHSTHTMLIDYCKQFKFPLEETEGSGKGKLSNPLLILLSEHASSNKILRLDRESTEAKVKRYAQQFILNKKEVELLLQHKGNPLSVLLSVLLEANPLRLADTSLSAHRWIVLSEILSENFYRFVEQATGFKAEFEQPLNEAIPALRLLMNDVQGTWYKAAAPLESLINQVASRILKRRKGQIQLKLNTSALRCRWDATRSLWHIDTDKRNLQITASRLIVATAVTPKTFQLFADFPDQSLHRTLLRCQSKMMIRIYGYFDLDEKIMSWSIPTIKSDKLRITSDTRYTPWKMLVYADSTYAQAWAEEIQRENQSQLKKQSNFILGQGSSHVGKLLMKSFESLLPLMYYPKHKTTQQPTKTLPILKGWMAHVCSAHIPALTMGPNSKNWSDVCTAARRQWMLPYHLSFIGEAWCDFKNLRTPQSWMESAIRSATALLRDEGQKLPNTTWLP